MRHRFSFIAALLLVHTVVVAGTPAVPTLRGALGSEPHTHVTQQASTSLPCHDEPAHPSPAQSDEAPLDCCGSWFDCKCPCPSHATVLPSTPLQVGTPAAGPAAPFIVVAASPQPPASIFRPPIR
jgi:hypothetical protein